MAPRQFHATVTFDEDGAVARCDELGFTAQATTVEAAFAALGKAVAAHLDAPANDGSSLTVEEESGIREGLVQVQRGEVADADEVFAEIDALIQSSKTR